MQSVIYSPGVLFSLGEKCCEFFFFLFWENQGYGKRKAMPTLACFFLVCWFDSRGLFVLSLHKVE